MTASALTPLESNALNWVLLCESLRLDPVATSALDVIHAVSNAQQNVAPSSTASPTTRLSGGFHYGQNEQLRGSRAALRRNA
ncbi:hypothetical protein AB0O58_19730 [Rhodococcus sp. NPDC080181]|jgi:hypothetical protein|uniref:hypothetical protein n=1 Tax=Rhodococcus sp. NPDC080181 TaxID=3155292 RepID=UPI00344B7E15